MGFTHFANVEDMCARLILHRVDTCRDSFEWITKYWKRAAGQSHPMAIRPTKHIVSQAFLRRLRWMASLVDQIDALNHHPEWRNVYNRVEVRLTTHDAGTLTELDIQLARVLDQSFDLMQG